MEGFEFVFYPYVADFVFECLIAVFVFYYLLLSLWLRVLSLSSVNSLAIAVLSPLVLQELRMISFQLLLFSRLSTN